MKFLKLSRSFLDISIFKPQYANFIIITIIAVIINFPQDSPAADTLSNEQ